MHTYNFHCRNFKCYKCFRESESWADLSSWASACQVGFLSPSVFFVSLFQFATPSQSVMAAVGCAGSGVRRGRTRSTDVAASASAVWPKIKVATGGDYLLFTSAQHRTFFFFFPVDKRDISPLLCLLSK